MKRVDAIWIAMLLMVAGCGVNRQVDERDVVITVDVTQSYPQKELILQDFMDVEYIPLETTNEFLCQGIVRAIGKEFIIVTNRLNDGYIFVFDRNGKGLTKFNHQGRGAQEYTNINQIILDGGKREMFVNDQLANQILVYDLFGNFKRSFRYEENSKYSDLYNFDENNLICKDASIYNDEETGVTPFVIISKQDGSMIKSIQISCQNKRPSTIKTPHSGFFVVAYVSNFPVTSIIPYQDSWMLTVYTNDTIFRYLPDSNLIPFIIRTPSVESGNSKANLSLGILTEGYYFLQTEKNEPEIRGTTPFDAYVEFAKTYLMYDRKDKQIYEYIVYNDDFSNKTSVNMSQNTVNEEIAFWQKLEADDLFEAHEQGQLKGKLKEVAADLHEESNPVIMLVKYIK